MIQYDWKYRKYKSKGKVSKEFSDVVPKKVHLRLNDSLWSSYTSITPFKEVTLLPYEPSVDLINFPRFKTPPRPERIWDEFKQSIFENWMENKIHVIGSSSGYDSRLIAKAIQELTKRHGKEWLGETYFVECAGEEEGFVAVMKKLGFKNYIVWVPDFSFEYFKDLHKRFNGICAYPMNQWYDYYVKNYDLDKIQYISGYGGNVADAMNVNSPYMGSTKNKRGLKGRLVMYFKKQHYYQLSAFRQPKYSLHPFWTWRYISAVTGINHREARTAKYLCDIFVKECTDIKRMRILDEVTKNGHRTVSDKVVSELYDWYRSTNFGKRYDCQPVNKIEYDKWWLFLCIASYAETNNISIN